VPQWIAEGQRLRLELPVDVQETLFKHERAGTTSDLEYIEAMNVFYHRHVCVSRTPSRLLGNYPVERRLRDHEWPTEFAITGTLKDWDIVDRLHEIRVPTLLVSGRHDEATPAIVETIHERILESQWVLFEDSSHLPHLEETERFLDVVTTFLTQVEVTL
jgi:proline-specific peptidase